MSEDKDKLPARAIYDSEIMRVSPGDKITQLAFTWSGTLMETLKAYDGTRLLFTLTFEWNAGGTLKSVTRT